MKKIVEEKEYAGYQLMGNAFNVEATGSNVKQLILKKLEIFMKKSFMQLPLGVLRTGQVKIMKVLKIILPMEF